MPFGFTRSVLGTPLPVAASAVSLGLSPVLDTRTGQYSTSAYEQVNLSSAFAPYVGSTGRLVFQYTSGSSFTGDIQVDDINIGSSNNYSFEATGQSFETTTDGSTDTTRDDTFYQGLSFTSVLTSGIASNRWNRDLGGTSSGSTGLAFADAGSYYLYVETTSPGFPYKVTWLRSPEVTLDTATLNFALGRYGATIGTLRVFWEVTSLPPLYSFSSFTFTDGGQTGYTGPSLSTLLASSDYDTGTYTWLSNTDYFDVDSTVQGMQLWTVPETGSYRITAKGAPGGSVGTSAFTGGIGAEISGEFTLTKGDILEIVVGQAGSDRNSGASGAYGGACGGGGSFVVARNGSTSSDIYVIAGGGGGAEADNRFGRGTSTHGGSGRSTATGGNSSNSGGTYGQPAPNYTAGSFGDRTKGGGSGYGGGGGVGGGGGGFFDRGGTGNATSTLMATNTQCGYGYLTGTGYTAAYRAQGGRSNTSLETGGFGAGGGSQILTGYGGGGGGYSGGGAGTFVSSTQGNGGGGGSYNSGTNQTSTTYTEATHPGSLSGHDAFVTIEAI